MNTSDLFSRLPSKRQSAQIELKEHPEILSEPGFWSEFILLLNQRIEKKQRLPKDIYTFLDFTNDLPQVFMDELPRFIAKGLGWEEHSSLAKKLLVFQERTDFQFGQAFYDSLAKEVESNATDILAFSEAMLLRGKWTPLVWDTVCDVLHSTVEPSQGWLARILDKNSFQVKKSLLELSKEKMIEGMILQDTWTEAASEVLSEWLVSNVNSERELAYRAVSTRKDWNEDIRESVHSLIESPLMLDRKIGLELLSGLSKLDPMDWVSLTNSMISFAQEEGKFSNSVVPGRKKQLSDIKIQIQNLIASQESFQSTFWNLTYPLLTKKFDRKISDFILETVRLAVEKRPNWIEDNWNGFGRYLVEASMHFPKNDFYQLLRTFKKDLSRFEKYALLSLVEQGGSNTRTILKDMIGWGEISFGEGNDAVVKALSQKFAGRRNRMLKIEVSDAIGFKYHGPLDIMSEIKSSALSLFNGEYTADAERGLSIVENDALKRLERIVCSEGI